jgi:hypothetical protein
MRRTNPTAPSIASITVRILPPLNRSLKVSTRAPMISLFVSG